MVGKFFVQWLLLGVAVFGCAQPKTRRIPVVASTTLISTIIQSVGGDRFEVTTIAPAGLCPGHFDLKPSDITAANQAKLLLNHGWEGWFPRLEKAVWTTDQRRVTLTTQGNWMIPDLQKRAAAEITVLLMELDSTRADTYRLALGRYQTDVDSAAAAALAMLDGKALPAVIATEQQAPFVAWLGLRVVATYGRAEDFTAQEMTRLARVAIDSGVKLIVDNLQSGPDAGAPLAEALKVKHVTLTNFPMEGSYSRSLLDNTAALARAIE
ncbi:MAG: metal ABC transporter substrate-binding protein [candidate division WOR-3 bacterium]|nr:metal ABC transporter substrate-binding protein [candidate division WOR-3 bacterium]